MPVVVTIPDEVADAIADLAKARGVSVDQVLIEAVQQLAGRDPRLVERVSASIERHREILDRLAAT